MTTRTFEATIRLPNGRTENVEVQAKHGENARSMIEAQYGKGCIVFGPAPKN